jgi:hypothetical protein
MAGMFDRLMGVAGLRTSAKPYSEQGVAGFAVQGGYVTTTETNANLFGARRWMKAADILSNTSIVAASVRFSLNLMSQPKWKANPPSDKPEAKAMAEFVEEVINGADTSWPRIVRRMGMYRYHGFSTQEWIAKKRDDGKVGVQSIEARPQQTIHRWDVDDNGGILGVVQIAPQTGKEIYLPRQKLLYCVDDAFTDKPDGMGWFRHLVDPFERLQKYLTLETIGFERDLSGIPIGRAPISRINQMVKDGKLTKDQAKEMVDGLKSFVKLKSKQPTTGMVMDSEPYRAKTDTGETISSVMEWGLELLTGNPSGIEALGNAIHRLMLDMALIIGTDSLLIGQSSGGRSSGGSRALSQDKSRNFYLTINSALGDMAEAADRDVVTPIWAMNGFPDELRPKLAVEDAAFKDVETIAKALADMATAGAILQPNDPAIDDLRQAMGLPKQPEIPDDVAAAALANAVGGVGGPAGGGTGTGQGGAPSRENPTQPGDPPAKKAEGRGRAAKYDPDEPRNDQGEWTDGGGGGSVLFEVAPNPDHKDLLDRWNALSDVQKATVTDQISQEFTPRVLESMGVHGHVEDAVGGFEGHINPSLVLNVDERPFEVAGAIGDTFHQKAMVVMNDGPGAGLKKEGIISVIAPNASSEGLRSIQEKVGDLADGWTYHNGRVQILNFSGQSNVDFANAINERLDGKFMVEHGYVYSAYIEEKDYARPRSDAQGNPWGQVRGPLREAFSQRLEEKLQTKTKGLTGKYSPDQPRDYHGRWTDGGGSMARPLTSAARAALVADNVDKPLAQLKSEAHANQAQLRQIGGDLHSRLGVDFVEAPADMSDKGVKTDDSIIRKVRNEGYPTPGHLTDISRATFVVDTPQDGDRVTHELAQEGTVYDKGWNRNNQAGYLDRKLYMKFPNGGVAEIQVVPRGIQQLKDGIGHRLYDIAREPSQPRAIRKAALRRSRLLYGRSLDGSGFESLGRAQ